MKKFLSMLMAVAMVATMGISALASSGGSGSSQSQVWDGSLSAAGSVALPEIDVVCSAPSTGAKLFVNPYQFELKTDTAEALTLAEDGETGTDRPDTKSGAVFSPTYVLFNKTAIALDVYVNGKAEVKSPSTMTIAKADVLPDSTKKEVCIYAHFGAVTLEDASSLTTTVKTFTPGTDASTKFMLGAAEAKEAQKVATLAKSTAEAFSAVGFEFDGSAAKDPKEAWVEADKVDVSLVITFKPAATTSSGSGT